MADELPRVEQEKVLLSWKAKSRPFKPAEEQTRSVLVVLGILVGLVLIFAREIMLLLVIIAGALLYWLIKKRTHKARLKLIIEGLHKNLQPL